MEGLTKSQKALREKWVEALRSGDYEQTTERLEGPVLDDDGEATSRIGHCCLGVLCRVIEPEGSISQFRAKPGEGYPPQEILNEETLAMVGISLEDQYRLTNLNDDGVSFEEIADLLEHLPAPEK